MANLRSQIWKYFTKAQDGNCARCTICLNVLSCKLSSSNLRRHMKSRHKSIFVEPFYQRRRQRFGNIGEKTIKEENNDQSNTYTESAISKNNHKMPSTSPVLGDQRGHNIEDTLEANNSNIVIEEIIQSDDADYEIPEEDLENTHHGDADSESENTNNDNEEEEEEEGDIQPLSKLKTNDLLTSAQHRTAARNLLHVLTHKRLRKENEELKKVNKDTQKNNSAFPVLDDFDHLDLFFLIMSKMTKKLSMVEQSNVKILVSGVVLKAELRYETSLQNNARIQIVDASYNQN